MNDIEIEWDNDVYLDVYKPIVGDDASVKFFWGGRDGGKTHHIGLELVHKCLTQDYFKCLLIRDTYDSVKDSQYETIKSIVNEYSLEELFHFTVNPLKITCINGNSFLARGCNDVDRIKSVKDPTDAWYEEGNKIKETDRTTIQTTLRSNKAKVQEWFSFNPECEGNYEDFWLYKEVGDHTGVKRWTRTVEVNGQEVTLNYTSIHTTLDTNPYCPPERAAIYETLQLTDPYYYQVYRYGEWGNRLVENQFAHQFSKEKHVSDLAEFDPSKRLFISLDFNLSPFGAIFFHDWDDKYGGHMHVFDEITVPNANIDKVCDYIEQKYGEMLPNCGITGDSMGKKKELNQRDNSSYYNQIKRRFNLSPFQMSLPNNPTHANSRADINYFFVHFPDFAIHPRCKNLIRDMMFVECDAYGKIKKADRNNEAQRADHLDCERYAVNTYRKKWIKEHQKKMQYKITR